MGSLDSPAFGRDSILNRFDEGHAIEAFVFPEFAWVFDVEDAVGVVEFTQRFPSFASEFGAGFDPESFIELA